MLNINVFIGDSYNAYNARVENGIEIYSRYLHRSIYKSLASESDAGLSLSIARVFTSRSATAPWSGRGACGSGRYVDGATTRFPEPAGSFLRIATGGFPPAEFP